MQIKNFTGEGVSGTTGIVFRAVDEMGRDVAVKFYNVPLGPLRDTVLRHAKATAQIQHPNIVSIYSIEDVGRPLGDGKLGEPEPALIMEYVPGQSFSDWLNNPNLSRSEVVSVLEGMLNGLAAFHAHKIGHGDLHGQNVRVHNGKAKLIDAIAYNPERALSTADFIQQRQSDLMWAKRQIVEALQACNPNTQAFGELCVLNSFTVTTDQLLDQLRLALIAPNEAKQGLLRPAANFYQYCRDSIGASNSVARQEARKYAVRSFAQNLFAWRDSHKTKFSDEMNVLIGQFSDLFNSIDDLGAYLVASAESGADSFQHDARLLKTVYGIEWERSGLSRVVGVPQSLVFALHYFAGAAALYNERFDVAASFARLRFLSSRRQERTLLIDDAELTGWAPTLNGNCSHAFLFLKRAYGLIPLLRHAFPNEASYQASVAAYNWFISLVDLVGRDPQKLLKARENTTARIFGLSSNIPPYFLLFSSERIADAYDLLFGDAGIWLGKNGNLRPQQLSEFWTQWMENQVEFSSKLQQWNDAPSFIFKEVPRFD